MTCTAHEDWPDHNIRLTCCLPAGHPGDHMCAELTRLTEDQETDR